MSVLMILVLVLLYVADVQSEDHQTQAEEANETIFAPKSKKELVDARDAWFADEVAAEATYGHISSWDTSRITSMSQLFRYVRGFNQDLSKWDTSQVTDMSSMFESATVFNQDLSKWDTSKVTDMSFMFCHAEVFNHDLSNWDTSKVTSMSSMFHGASTFNQDLSKWKTSKVTDMQKMFWEARAFNQDLSAWDTSKVTDMFSMFWGALAFNQCLTNWVSKAPALRRSQMTQPDKKQYLGICSMAQLTCRDVSTLTPCSTTNSVSVASSCITLTVNSFLMICLIAFQKRP